MKGLPRSLGRAAPLARSIVHDSIPIDLTFAVTDPGLANGWGTAMIEGLPVGNILYLGAVSEIQFTGQDVNIIDTFTGNMSIGTAPTADNLLTDPGEADIVPATAIGAATAKVSPLIKGVSTNVLSGPVLDNSAGALELNLNINIADASISANSSIRAVGVLHIAYIMLGD